MFIFSRIKGWIEAIIAVIVAFGSAYFWALIKGRSEGKQDVRKADEKASAEQVKNDLNLRQTIDASIASLSLPKVTVPPPITPQEPSNAQPIGNAQPDTAAGRLQNDWLSKS